jgi:arylsulfatase/arylsulfatase A
MYKRLTSLVLVSASFVMAADRPNIVLVMTDDQGYGDFGAVGNTVIKTPHIDAMAKRSASWEEFYVSPVCSPTRASLMTGRYNHRTKCIDTFLGRSMMAADEVTIAEVLEKNGYETGIFGKWHLGDNYPMRPSDQGFSYSLIHKGGGLGQPADPRDNKARYTDALLFENDREVQTEGYCTDVFFDKSFDFMEQSKKNGKPFFAYVALNAPHSPYHDVPEELYQEYKKVDFSPIIVDELKGKSLDKEQDKLARISAMITNIDDNMGRLFTKLDEMGETENTIVLYLTDNGPNTRRYVGPFRGKKSELQEGGVRTPIWMQWPKVLKAGATVKKSVAAHIDLMPTLLDACGVEEMPENMDGRSVLEKLKNPDSELDVRPLVIQYHRGDEISKYHSCMVRKGQWKLVHPSGTQKEKFEGTPKWELYDVIADPSESKDLIDVETKVADELKAVYEAWFADVADDRADQPGPPYIVIEKDKENPSVLTWQDMIESNWRPNKVGYYKVEFTQDGRYDFRSEAALGHKIPSDKKWTAHLKIGDKEFTTPFHLDQKIAVFEAIEVPAGKYELRSKIVSEDGEEWAIFHTRVIHR